MKLILSKYQKDKNRLITGSNSNLTDSLFTFFSKDKRQVKILEVEENNIWLYQNDL